MSRQPSPGGRENVYQFLDTRIPAQSVCENDANQNSAETGGRTIPTGSRGLIGTISRSVANTVAWLWGLYKINAANKLEAKPAQCAFARYPESCQPPPTPASQPHAVYLPVIRRGIDLWRPQ